MQYAFRSFQSFQLNGGGGETSETSSGGRLLDAVGGLVEVQGQVRLPLVMRFMPGEHLRPVLIRPRRLLVWLGGESFVVNLLEQRDRLPCTAFEPFCTTVSQQ